MADPPRMRSARWPYSQRIGMRKIVVHDGEKVSGDQKRGSVDTLRDHDEGIGTGRVERGPLRRLDAELAPFGNAAPFGAADLGAVEFIGQSSLPSPRAGRISNPPWPGSWRSRPSASSLGIPDVTLAVACPVNCI